MPEENTLPATESPAASNTATPAAGAPAAVKPPDGSAVPPSRDAAAPSPSSAGASAAEPAAAAAPSQDSAPLPPYTAAEPSSDAPQASGSAGTPDPVQTGPVPAAGSEPAASALTPPAAPRELTPSVGLPSAPGGEMSVKDMFLNADPVVQGVMLLLLASLATWMIIFEKTFLLRNTSRNIMLFKKAAADGARAIEETEFPPLTRSIAAAGLRESRDAAGNETRSDYRERVERSMRAEFSGLMDRVGYRVLFLATVGAVSPFVGLFGTVWGIMHSFIGIAASGETTLAVVAPGIAEALFATAMGLVAAIPAVIAYNKITGTMKKITKEALAGIGFLGNRLAGRHFGGRQPEG